VTTKKKLGLYIIEVPTWQGLWKHLKVSLSFIPTANTYKAEALTYWAVSLAFLDLFGI
jgi:hypothetical protein